MCNVGPIINYGPRNSSSSSVRRKRTSNSSSVAVMVLPRVCCCVHEYILLFLAVININAEFFLIPLIVCKELYQEEYLLHTTELLPIYLNKKTKKAVGVRLLLCYHQPAVVVVSI